MLFEKISTTTMDSYTGFLGENPTHKGNFHTEYGNSLCILFSSNVVEIFS
jgi:hypothetical protein